MALRGLRAKVPTMHLAHYTSWKVDGAALPMKCSTHWVESNYWKQKLIQEYEFQNSDVLEELCRTLPQLRQILSSLMDLVSHGKYASELLKELVFENVRQEKFPSLPSRKRCIYLLELENHTAAIQRFGFSTERPTAVRVEVENAGDLFHADASLLNCNLLKYKQLTEQAERYWSGERSSKPLLEYLYVGEFTIVGRL